MTSLRAYAPVLAGILLAIPGTPLQLSGQDNPLARPLSLNDVLDSVRRGHPRIAAAQARARVARGARTTAGVLGNPIFAYQVENARLPGREAPPMEREDMTTATLPLEPLYQRGARVRRADAELRAATGDALVEERRVLIAAARAFYRTALAQVSHNVARELATWLDSLVVYNRARTEEGVAAEADLIRSELERDRATVEATMNEADLARARAELESFLGDQGSGRQIAVRLEDAPLVAPTIDAELQSAVDLRPDVRAARDRTIAARAGVTSERTMLLRQLGVTVGTKRSAGFTSLIAGLSVPFPLFDQNRGEIARAAAERDAASLDLAATEREARGEIAGASAAARTLTSRASSLAGGSSTFLSRADEARRIALGAYREGAVPLMQVLDAARAWGEARLTFYRLLVAQHESVLELLVAQGRDPSSVPERGTPNR